MTWLFTFLKFVGNYYSCLHSQLITPHHFVLGNKNTEFAARAKLEEKIRICRITLKLWESQFLGTVMLLVQSCYWYSRAIGTVMQLVQSCNWYSLAIGTVVQLVQSCNWYSHAILNTIGADAIKKICFRITFSSLFFRFIHFLPPLFLLFTCVFFLSI